MNKQRLDLLLVEQGLAVSRSKAQALIKAGLVLANGQKTDKPSVEYAGDVKLEVTGVDHPWVSRGGMKLAHALTHFSIQVAGMTAIDVGASTGGFTDVLLQHGATKVYAVDVGNDQLHTTLRADVRVVVMEDTNARDLNAQMIGEQVDAVVCDASFISLLKVLPPALSFARTGATLVTLIKPQFEVGKEAADKGKGVIRDAKLHADVCDGITKWLTQSGWDVQGIVPSPIEGPKGNVEFLLYARKA